ncbi:MAG TPA: M48 family metallopeptidase [Verrucomicrobiae bacterium]|nr:M48 family metallopeptidase [Verrucomicrobiae bacterium]
MSLDQHIQISAGEAGGGCYLFPLLSSLAMFARSKMESDPNYREYRANAFAPSTGARMNAGLLVVAPNQLHFHSDTLTGSLPLGGLRLRRGGHNGEQIFFEHPEYLGWSIYSSDEALWRDPILSVHPLFADELRAVGRSRSSIPKPVIIGLALLAILLGGLVLLWFAKDRIAEILAERVPRSWEQTFGDKAFEAMTHDGKLLTNSVWQKDLDRITSRLLPAVADSGYVFRFHILQDTNVNAFAIPGGNVVILTGLLEEAATLEEVAGVLAHELSHVTRRHSLRNLVKSAGLLVVIQAALGDASGLIAVAGEGSRYLLQQKFSRDFEREADDSGWNYLVAANIDPRGMIEFFRKLKELAQSSGMGAMEGSLSLINTHPTSQERMDRLEAKWRDLPKKSGFIPLGPWEQKRPNR